MTQPAILKRRNIAAWILRVSLVLSLVAFSGVDSPVSTRQQTFAIELRPPESTGNKRSVSYGSVDRKLPLAFCYTDTNFQKAVTCADCQVKIRIEQNTRCTHSFLTVRHYMISQNTPHHSDEDSSHPLIG